MHKQVSGTQLSRFMTDADNATMWNRWRAAFILVCISLIISNDHRSHAQANRIPGDAFPRLIQANEQFGIQLLRSVRDDDPNRNVVVAPTSPFLLLSAVRDSIYSDDS